jgi:uncharacterized phage protein (TIGR02218 family)
VKTLIDNGTAGATLALLDSGADFQMMDLWAITLNGGTVIRWHSGQLTGPVTFNGHTYTYGPGIDRGKISTKLGVEVATLDMTISATPADLVNGVPLIPFAQGRGFDGATVILYRAFLASWSSPITGATIAFSGRVTQLKDVSRAKFTMTVSAWTVLLNVNMGPDVFQAGCLNTHYDASCGLTATNVAGTVASGATTLAFNTNLTNPDHYFDKGTITFLTGANAGVSRAVQTYLNASGNVAVAFPLPFAPSSGDTFHAVRGCLLTMADCSAQSNLIHFRGQPFTPPAITGAIG